ncbi:MAG: glycosyltransferase family 2 protein [Gemmatimonadaceae bacterium]|nr:glycosyltransferase family 2 protein [Gemmatimonadaceae bacterium]
MQSPTLPASRPTTSLIIATYNWPAALDVILRSVRAQHVLPDEVLVADDGSGDATRLVVVQHQTDFPVPLKHVWHEDQGFRLAAIRNEAIRQAQGDYVLQIDGDIVLHPRFVEAHAAFARRGTYVQGSRCMMSQERTARMLQDLEPKVSLFQSGLKNRLNGLYMPMLSSLVRGPSDPDRRTRGCHMAFWRSDLLAVNGYDERFEGWGREDSEMAARLIHAGIRRRNFKFGAVAFHLWHPEATRAAFPANHERYVATIEKRSCWCDVGLLRPSGARKQLLAV